MKEKNLVNNNSDNAKEGSKKQKNDDKKSIAIVLSVLALIVIIVILLLLRSCNNTAGNENHKPSLNIADGQSISDLKEPVEYSTADYIELPFLSELIINKANNTVALQNPESNTVYMGFEIIDKKTETTVYTSDSVVAPGQYIEWFPMEYFKEKGTYGLTINIKTYDVNDESDCSGASIDSSLIIQ